jgi:diguanylate cyclase (GGDEF)-like protein
LALDVFRLSSSMAAGTMAAAATWTTAACCRRGEVHGCARRALPRPHDGKECIPMDDAEPAVFLSDQPAGRAAARFAGGVVVASTIVFLALVPFARTPLPPLPAFIAVYQSAQVINDLITAVFLFGQSHFARSRPLAVLAGAYLFVALIAATHELTFPGLFAPGGLLGAGPQTTAWLYMFWHGGFPLLVMLYVVCPRGRPGFERGMVPVLVVAALALLAACGCTALATLGHDRLPAVMAGNHYTPIAAALIGAVWLLNLLGLLALLRRRSYSVLDLWLIVTMCAWLFDIALSALFNAGRYDLGFYAGRIYGFLAASFVLGVLLVENTRLYVQLAGLRDSARAKAAELARLSATDPLTGIANRRTFAETLEQEWRRMMRHKTPLSLLMIDVDYFKRFNDSYGHVAGDQCLRAVAQTIAGRARRAGELAARYGGEEFAVLLPHCDVAAASRLAALICQSVRDRRIAHAASGAAPYVTVSIGVAGIADVPKSVAALSRETAASLASQVGGMLLVEAADQALYRAKMAGRDRWQAAGSDDIDIAAAADVPVAAASIPLTAK